MYRGRRPPLLLAALVLLAGPLGPAPAAGAAPAVTISVAPTPFSPDGDGIRDTAWVTVGLAQPATLSLVIEDREGRVVRTLASGSAWSAGRSRYAWDGRNDAGKAVANAFYRARAVVSDGVGITAAVAGVTRARTPIYPRRPGLITVAVDPGHGGPDPGARYGGYRESDLNLDISLRLAAMLEGAGVRVMLLRRSDVGFNPAGLDRTGDGVVDRRDDLQARLDLVNRARPDLLVIVMNNASGCHCRQGTQTFRNPDRAFGGQNHRLATAIHAEHLRLLPAYDGDDWVHVDSGIRNGTPRHHQLRSYDPASAPRPALLPTVMGESLFMDRPPELARLARPEVRQSIAEAYYEGIARYLAARPSGVRYQLLSGPTTATPGAAVSYRVSVSNRGNAALDGARLEVRSVRAVPLYDGSGRRGYQRGAAALPPILPGAGIAIDVVATAPTGTGRYLLKLDIRLPTGAYLADRGVAPLQIPLAVRAP